MISEGFRFDQITVLALCIRIDSSEQNRLDIISDATPDPPPPPPHTHTPLKKTTTKNTNTHKTASGQGLHC